MGKELAIPKANNTKPTPARRYEGDLPMFGITVRASGVETNRHAHIIPPGN